MLDNWLLRVIRLILHGCRLIRKETLMLRLRGLLPGFVCTHTILCVELSIYPFGSISTGGISYYLGRLLTQNLLVFLLSLSALRPVISVGSVILSDINLAAVDGHDLTGY